MKKIIYILFAVLMVVSISSCTVDNYSGLRPCNYPNSTWRCEDPYVFFTVEDEDSTARKLVTGRYEYKQDGHRIEVNFNYGTRIYFESLDNDSYGKTLLEGDCKFYKDRCVVNVDH
ncbi:MAG: hypothetical protein IJL87_04555, partial [Clostridia bacterium]|nr:hypothetical protein [Clostridia bacterium]